MEVDSGMVVSLVDPREVGQIQHEVSGFQKECENITSKHRKVTVKPANNDDNSIQGYDYRLHNFQHAMS